MGARHANLSESEVADGGEGMGHPCFPFWKGTTGGGDEGTLSAGDDAGCAVESGVAGWVCAKAEVDVRVGTVGEGAHAGQT